jgi:excisionase family DNA binding protein
MAAIAYTIDEACRASGVGRTRLYAALRGRELRARKHGKRTIILADDLRQWLEALPAYAPARAA